MQRRKPLPLHPWQPQMPARQCYPSLECHHPNLGRKTTSRRWLAGGPASDSTFRHLHNTTGFHTYDSNVRVVNDIGGRGGVLRRLRDIVLGQRRVAVKEETNKDRNEAAGFGVLQHLG